MEIEVLRNRMLKAAFPAHGDAPPEKWQQRKSAQTRARLIDAGVDCLVENGYAGLTTASVAERCDLARGSMHHHFATRMDLVEAVAEHVLYRRLDAFLADYLAAMRQADRSRFLAEAYEAHWRSVHLREYAAYLQLAVAARSDAELDALLRPALLRYDEAWIIEMTRAFPDWRERWENMALASDFITAAHIGMLVNEPILSRGDRMERLGKLLMRVLAGLHDDP